MKIIYNDENNTAEFDMQKYLKSLNKYGQVSKEQVLEGLKDFAYDPLHYSCLVELGVKLLPDEKAAKDYWNDHQVDGRNFERLRRITGYLVGSLERWNDAKKAEEMERVKHGVGNQYSPEHKTAVEVLKYENSVISQF